MADLNGIFHTYPIITGLFLIIIGLAAILFAFRYPEGKNSMLAQDFGGYAGGLLSILLGILVLLNYFS